MRTLLILFFCVSAAFAQMPQHLNHQGRVTVQGTNFHGVGQFKFALVDGGTNLNQPALASGFATLFVTHISIDSGGSGYAQPPSVTIAPPDLPGGTQATATATIEGGVVTAITVTNPGSGYGSHPQVTIAPPPPNLEHQIYWSNSGDLAAGEVPATWVELPVERGLYSVRLGDPSVANMAPFFTTDIFYTPLYLRIWFNDGMHGFQQLTPDQPLAAAPYAMHARLAESVAPNSVGGNQIVNGSITSADLAPGSVTAGVIAQGAVSSSQLSAGAAAQNLANGGQSAVASGGVVLSTPNNSALVAAGYVRIAPVIFDERWTTGNGTLGASVPLVAWTGTKLFVWQGAEGGGLYDPAFDTWTPLPASAPNAPGYHVGSTCIWTGTEVIVWGGGAAENSTGNAGARFNPATLQWTAIPSTLANTPSPRRRHTAVWTGTRMLVWGGALSGPTGGSQTVTFGNSGGLFDPSANSGSGAWTPTPVNADAPSARAGHAAVWDGSKMIIWGGEENLNYATTLGALSVEGDSSAWIPNFEATVTGSSPGPRLGFSTLWTGSEMIIWGGQFALFSLNSGARFNPQTKSWAPLSTTGAPTGRFGHSAVWTGSEMIVYGGEPVGQVAPTTGARYVQAEDRWEALTAGPHSIGHAAVWTGIQMVAAGGTLSRPWTWTAARKMDLYQRP